MVFLTHATDAMLPAQTRKVRGRALGRESRCVLQRHAIHRDQLRHDAAVHIARKEGRGEACGEEGRDHDANVVRLVCGGAERGALGAMPIS